MAFRGSHLKRPKHAQQRPNHPKLLLDSVVYFVATCKRCPLLVPSKVLATSGDARSPVRSVLCSLLLVAMPFVPSSFLLLVVRPGAPSSVLAPSSDALCS